MRKTVILALFCVSLCIPLFAGKLDVMMKGTVGETAYSLSLKYGEKTIGTQNVYDIYGDKPWNLLEDGKTNTFVLVASGNEPKSKEVKIDVQPEEFKAVIDEETYSGPVVKFVTDEQSQTEISAGMHKDTPLATFHFEWSGNEKLPAGEYASDIKVTYSAS